VHTKPETPEEKSQREYRDRTKNISADRLVPYELYSLRMAITELSANLGKRTALVELALQQGLTAIALAASTPADNSAQVQEQIDKNAAEIHAAQLKLQSSITRNQPEGEA
jgi:hypothetical protein